MIRTDIPEVLIYTDGACDPNPGPGGWAALLLSGRHRKEIVGSEKFTTNNRMELMAALKALETLTEPHQVSLFTDSQYLHLGITEWMPTWIKRGWRRKSGRLANVEVWQALQQEIQKHQIDWNWVKGHAGDPLNERVNWLAQKAIWKK